MIRKQLSSSTEDICICGIAGSLALLSDNSETENSVFDFDQASCSQPAKRHLESSSNINPAVTELFLLAAKSASRFVVTGKYFYNLATNLIVLNSIPRYLIDSLNDEIGANFQQHFIVELESHVKTDNSSFEFSLDDEAMVAFDVNGQKDDLIPLLCINEQFFLLQQLERHINDTLDNIDAVLGCPLILPTHCRDNSDCIVYFCALNLVRIIINVFSDQSDPQMQQKCKKKLNHIKLLEERLEMFLRNFKKGVSLMHLQSDKQQDIITQLSETTEVLSKSRHHSKDKKSTSTRSSNIEVTIKSNTLRKQLVKLDRKVLDWVTIGIAEEDGKGKCDDKLLLSEFLVLANEIVYQLKDGDHDLESLLMFALENLHEYLSRNEMSDFDEIENFIDLLLKLDPVHNAVPLVYKYYSSLMKLRTKRCRRTL